MNPDLHYRRKRKRRAPPTARKRPDTIDGDEAGYWLMPEGSGYRRVPVLKSEAIITNGMAQAQAALLREGVVESFPWLRSELRRSGCSDGLQRAAFINGCALLLREGDDAYFGGDAKALPYLAEDLAQATSFIEIGLTTSTVLEEAPELGEPERLEEATLRQLLDLTQANGFYAQGGLRRVGGRWVIDPAVRGRTDNSRFVVVSTPRWELGPDGLPILTYRCRSRPDRNTSGLVQTGFIKIISREGFFRRLGRRVLGGLLGGRLDPQVQTFCSCQDWRYRFHWVMAQMGAAPTPTGRGNAPPDITNPSHRPSLCKHLTAMAAATNFSDSRLQSLLQGRAVEPEGPDQSPTVPPETRFAD